MRGKRQRTVATEFETCYRVDAATGCAALRHHHRECLDDLPRKELEACSMNEEKSRRKYQRISPEHLEYAKGRFVLMASTSAVRAEIKSIYGVEYPHNALFYWWKKANPPVQTLVVKRYKLAPDGGIDPYEPAEVVAANPPKRAA